MSSRMTWVPSLKPGERFFHGMRWREVLGKPGNPIPGDGRVEIRVRDEKSGEEQILKIRASTRVRAYTKKKEDA